MPEVPLVPEVDKRSYEWKAAAKNILDEGEKIEAAYQREAAKDFMVFCRGLTIDSQTGPRVFENCMERFQRLFFEDIADSLHAIRDGRKPPFPRWWVERTKKGAKDADLAIIMLWFLAFPTRPLYMQVGAANREQAGIVKDRITHLLHWNPWLNEYVEMIQSEVKSRKLVGNGRQPLAKMHIMSSDIAGAHGGTPDVLIINELSHITRWEFAENLMDNADGVANGLAIIATNAGFKGTKAEVWRKNALANHHRWCTHLLDRPAPWHDTRTIHDAKMRNPRSRYLRLWWGRWASGKGDAVSEDHIERSFCLKGPTQEPEEGWIYIAGLDLGISHDHSGLAVVGVSYKEQKVRLAWMKSWQPTKSGEVDLMDVEAVCRQVAANYRLAALYYDPHQAKLMAQRLTRVNVPMREMTFSSATNITAMTTAFVGLIESGKLECYDDPGGCLRRDFGKFNIVEKPYGLKLEAVSDEFGHADVGTALVIALPAAMQILSGSYDFVGGDDPLVADFEDEPMSKEEVKRMPAALREIYESESEQEPDRYNPLGDLD